MFETLLKYLLYEKAINTLFERITINFTKVFPMPNKGDTIEIKFYKTNGTRVWTKDAQVHNAADSCIIIIYTIYNTEQIDTFTLPDNNNKTLNIPTVTKTIELVFKENIIHWKRKESPLTRDTLYNGPFGK